MRMNSDQVKDLKAREKETKDVNLKYPYLKIKQKKI